MNEIVNSLGEKIKHFRKQQRMTQAELSDKSGISLASIKKYEQDIRVPKIEQLLKLSASLNTPLSDLIIDSTLACVESPTLNRIFHANGHYLIDKNVLLTFLVNIGCDIHKTSINGADGYEIYFANDECYFITLSELDKVSALVKTDTKKIIETFGKQITEGNNSNGE